MRKFTVKGKTYKLTEKDYQQLLERFDINLARDAGSRTFIDNLCVCPGRSSYRCSDCCLGSKRFNCLILLRYATEMRRPPNIHFNVGFVSWETTSKTSPEYLSRVREALLSLPKVRR